MNLQKTLLIVGGLAIGLGVIHAVAYSLSKKDLEQHWMKYPHSPSLNTSWMPKLPKLPGEAREFRCAELSPGLFPDYFLCKPIK